MNNNFEVGDVVKLKSGGPNMTVAEIFSDGRMHCNWYRSINDSFSFYTFSPEMVRKVEEMRFTTIKPPYFAPVVWGNPPTLAASVTVHCPERTN